MATKGDHATLHSSIALLQERFRQLQKIREMRQERELLHVLSASETERIYSSSHSTTHHTTMQKDAYKPSTLHFDHSAELINFPQKPSSQLALSLWPDSQMIKNSNLGGFETRNGRTTTMVTNKPWLDGTNLGYNKSDTSFKCDDPIPDIDTSLHL